MRRLLLIVMLLIVPLQFSWAVAATYCNHESNPTTYHWGHHSHQHKGTPAEEKAGSQSAQLGVDSDCAACQLSGIGALMPLSSPPLYGLSGLERPATTLPLRSSNRAHRPERPKWRHTDAPSGMPLVFTTA